MPDNGRDDRDIADTIADRVVHHLTPARGMVAPSEVSMKIESWPKAVLVTLAVVAAGAIASGAVAIAQVRDAKVKTESHEQRLATLSTESAVLRESLALERAANAEAHAKLDAKLDRVLEKLSK